MSIQFNISPIPTMKVVKKVIKNEEDEITELKMALFTPTPKLSFENIHLGTTAVRKLLVKNPGLRDTEVSVKRVPQPDRNVTLNWTSIVIPANGEAVLLISWRPLCEGTWRDTLEFEDRHHLRKDVPIAFKSVNTKKTNSKVKSKPRPSYVSKKVKVKTPPQRKPSPKQHQQILKKYINVKNIHDLGISSLNEKNMEAIPQENCNMRLLTPNFHDSNLFVSPSSTTFTMDSKSGPTRRETYAINTLEAINQNITPINSNYEVDHTAGLKSPYFNRNMQTHHSNLTTHTARKENVPPGNYTSVDKPSKSLESSEQLHNMAAELVLEKFAFTPVNYSQLPRVQLEYFEPSICSTGHKSVGNSSTETSLRITKQLFASNGSSSPLDIKAIDSNISHNISTGTYIKGNISTETIVNGNISSRTYVKDISANNLSQLREVADTTFSPILNASARHIDLSGGNARYIIEANLWCADENKGLTNIVEESHINYNSNIRKPQSLKRLSDAAFEVSPPKRVNLRLAATPSIKDWNKKLPRSNKLKSRNVPRRPIAPLNLNEIINKSLMGTGNKNGSQSDAKPVMLHDPDLFLATINPFILTATNSIDPFMSSTLFYDVKWVDEQEQNFMKWLNALLTPPAELDSKADGHPINVAKLWQECKRTDVITAPSKESVSNKYHTNHKLDILRRSAVNLFKSEEVSQVLAKVTMAVENQKLCVRTDRNIHLDVGLQSELMVLLLCYNPLWLRIGLETIFGSTIPLASNSDIMGLSTFILQNLLKNVFLLKKHKTMHSSKYAHDIKSFILKKFLMLVFFLDVAKVKKLIPHDPCLFCKNAPVKESKEILFRFAREVLSAVGDISKFLRSTGYVVQHRQIFIHEFDYAVNFLGADLRDGVRLAKVVEIIFFQDNITELLRVPAISRLQKIHNMKIVFESVKKAGFNIQGDIEPKDLVDGHKEKTLSFLWQIIYTFQTPRLTKAAITIQHWWRSLKIVIKSRVLAKRHLMRELATTKIQKWYRRRTLAYRLKQVIPLINQHITEQQLNRSATKIQSYFKMYTQRKKYINFQTSIITVQSLARRWLLKQKIQEKQIAVVKIQTHLRRWILRKKYNQLKAATLFVEEKYLAKKLMHVQRKTYCTLRASVLCVQQRYRAKKLRDTQQTYYQTLHKVVIKMQVYIRAKQHMLVQKAKYQRLRGTAILLQRRFRAKKAMKMEQSSYLQLKQSTIIIQGWYRACITMRIEKNRYQNLKKAAIMIQTKYKSKLATRKIQSSYQKLRKAVVTVQAHYRGLLIMRNYRKLKSAVKFVQNCYRAKLKMRKQHTLYQNLRKSSICIQARYRGILAMRRAKMLLETVIKMQMYVRAKQHMLIQKAKYQRLRGTAILLQRRFRAKKAMKMEQSSYLQLKQSTIIIQQWYRASISMRIEKNRYQNLKKTAIMIQTKYKSKLAMRKIQSSYQKLRRAVLTVQAHYRGLLIMRNYLKLKSAVKLVQNHYRAKLMMRKQHTLYQNLRKSAICIQARYRGILAMRKAKTYYKNLKWATVNIQKRYRATLAMRKDRKYYQKLRLSVICMQIRYKSILTMRCQHTEYQNIKKAAVVLQARYRAKITMRKDHSDYQILRKSVLCVQTRYRAILAMRNNQSYYQNLQKAASVVQSRYKAMLAMRRDRKHYLEMREATKCVQMRYRALLSMKREYKYYQKLRKSVAVVQNWCRGYLARKSFQDMKVNANLNEKRKQRFKRIAAAIKIQAAWRGYHARSEERPEITLLRKKCEQANLKALPQFTLGHRRDHAVQLLISDNPSLLQIVGALRDLDFITRRCPDTCISMSRLLPNQLYSVMCSTNRSLPEMQACMAATIILINFSKHPPSRDSAWVPEWIDATFTLMGNWCDKDELLFPLLCTLIWTFAHTETYKNFIIQIPNFSQRITKIKSMCLRKQKMHFKVPPKGPSVFLNYRNLPLPSLQPDWGFDYVDRPRVFNNAIHGLNSLLSILDVK